jgi:SSS family solute:Na+ symporter
VNLTLAVLVFYSVLMGVLGVWIGRRVRASGDFFVAGRTLGPGLIFATFLAANIGAGATVNAASLGYRDGLSAWWWNASAGIGSLIFAFTVGPRLWRESVEHGDLTLGDFIERRYDRTLRGLVAVLIWFGTLHILAAQLQGIATVLQVAAGMSKLAGCIAGAVIVSVYFVAGGLLSTAYVNLVQLVVKLIGFALVTPIAMAFAGGWSAITADPARLDLFAGSSPQSGWRLLFFLAPAFIVSPGLVQKALGARNTDAIKTGVALNGLALIVFATVPAMIGLSARTVFPDIPRDLAFATIAAALPPMIGGLALAAVFSAEASAADAVLLMLATSAAKDLYRGFVRPDASDRDVLRVARVAAVIGGVLGVGLAMMHETILQSISTFYALLIVTLFVPVVGGLFGGGGGRRQGLASLVGVPVLLSVHLATNGAGYGAVTPTIAGVLASTVAFLLTRRRPR